MSITKKQELSNVPISKLMPYAKNPRKNDAAVQRVAKSLEEFGLVKNSIVVDEDMVLITGHTTAKAMQALGWKNAPEVTQVFGLTAAQKQAYRIADNKLGEIAEWDMDQLGMELEELRGLDFDIELTGFDDEEFESMLKELDDDIPLDEGPSVTPEYHPEFVTPEYHPEFITSQITDADIKKSDRNLEQITHQHPTYIKAYCPKCGHEFDISG